MSPHVPHGNLRTLRGRAKAEQELLEAAITMEEIIKELPDEMAEAADWTLKLSDGSSLPCHSFCLCAVSPVLAFTLKTADKNVTIPVPAGISEDRIVAFLRWVYRLELVLKPVIARELASLCHEWDVKGGQQA